MAFIEGDILFDPWPLLVAANAFSKKAGESLAIKEHLEKQISGIISQWHGKNDAKFIIDYKEWNEQMLSQIELLRGISSELERMYDDIAEVDPIPPPINTK